MENEDGWIVVTKGPKSEKAAKSSQSNLQSNIAKSVSIKHTLKENKVMSDLEKSETKKSLLNLITNFLKTQEFKKLTIRSLGVGSVTSNINGFFQVMLMYIIQETLKKQYSKQLASLINDPVFSRDDVDFVKRHDMQRIDDDTKMMTIAQNETCIFYMPHCEQELYIKVLMLNSKSLNKICIIGNSLVAYLKKAEVTGKLDTEELEVLKKFVELKGYEEKKIPLLEERYEAFNDTYFITF